VTAVPSLVVTPRVHPSAALVLGTGMLALVVVFVVWPLVKYAIRVAHAGGQAVTASMFADGVASMRLTGSRSITVVKGGKGLGGFLVSLVGYLSPSLFGLFGALLLRGGAAKAVLWLSLVFLALILLQLGNLFGWLVVLATGTVLFLVARGASGGVQTFVAYTWVWLLLLGGFREALALPALRRAINTAAKDKDEAKAKAYANSDLVRLRKVTYLPTLLWVGFYQLATLGAVLLGGGILLDLVMRSRR
jgi:hypothetical protein